MNIRLFKPSFGPAELAAVEDSLNRSWVGLGPKVEEFEDRWERFLGCEEAIGLNSATAALHLALSVFNFPEGKKVLVPALTFAATATAVLHNGLVPVFVDSDPVTLGMDLADLDKKYDNDCVAVIPVHYAGHPVAMEALIPWAESKGLRVVEDCAHTTGSRYKGKNLGLWGDIGCFSFEEKKLMTTGDGGMICSNNASLLSRIRAMRWVGIDKDNWKTAQAYTDENRDALHWYYEIRELGFKYNMNDLAASIGIVQLGRIDEMNGKRAAIISRYLKALDNLGDVAPLLPYEPKKYAYQIFGIRTAHRNALMIYLKSQGVATGCHYTPLTLQPLFSGHAGSCPYIERESERFITLPLHADLSFDEVDYITKSIKTFFSNLR